MEIQYSFSSSTSSTTGMILHKQEQPVKSSGENDGNTVIFLKTLHEALLHKFPCIILKTESSDGLRMLVNTEFTRYRFFDNDSNDLMCLLLVKNNLAYGLDWKEDVKNTVAIMDKIVDEICVYKSHYARRKKYLKKIALRHQWELDIANKRIANISYNGVPLAKIEPLLKSLLTLTS